MAQDFVINDNDLDDFVCNFIEQEAEAYVELNLPHPWRLKMPRRYKKMLANVLLKQAFERTAANRAAIPPGTVHFLQAERERAERVRRALQLAGETVVYTARTDRIQSIMVNFIAAVRKRIGAKSVVARAPIMQRQVGGLRF